MHWRGDDTTGLQRVFDCMLDVDNGSGGTVFQLVLHIIQVRIEG